MAFLENKEKLLEWAQKQEDFPMIFIPWVKEDFDMAAEDIDVHELTEDQVLEAMKILDNGHDACSGVNWESVQSAIEIVLENEEK